MWKDLYQNIQYWKRTCYKTGKYTFCGCMSALFITQILQAGAVKGLKSKILLATNSDSCDKLPSHFQLFYNSRSPASPVLTSTFEWLPALKPRDSTGNYNSSQLLCLTEGRVLLRSGCNLRFCWRTPCPGLPAWCRTAWPGLPWGRGKTAALGTELAVEGGSHRRLMGQSLLLQTEKPGCTSQHLFLWAISGDKICTLVAPPQWCNQLHQPVATDRKARLYITAPFSVGDFGRQNMHISSTPSTVTV